MLYLNICVGLLTLLSTTLAKDELNGLPLDVLHFDVNSRTGKFGFMNLEHLRRTFCNSSCMSANTKPYIVNLVCAVKCPELYLPIHMSTSKQKEETTISSTIKG